MTTLLIDPKFHFHPKHADIYKKVKAALIGFPDISEVVLSSFYPKKNDKYEDGNTVALTSGNIVSFNMKIMPTYNTIYHELQHVIQGNRKSTTGKKLNKIETEATILGLARMHKSQVEENRLMYVDTVPKSRVVKYAKIAATEIKKGNKNAIKDIKSRINKDRTDAIKKDITVKSKWTKYKFGDVDVDAEWIKKGSKNYAKGYTVSKVNAFLKKVPNKPTGVNLIKPPNDMTWVYKIDAVKNPPKWMTSDKHAVTKKRKPTRK